MDSRDEELTLKNVDERVEQELSQLRTSPQPPTRTSLARAVRNLQSVYEEERRLERVWERINNHALTLNPAVIPDSGSQADEAITSPPLELAGQVARNGRGLAGGNFAVLSRKIRSGRQAAKQRRWQSVAFGLVAAVVLIALFVTIFAWSVLPFHGQNSQAGHPHSTAQTVAPPPQPILLSPRTGPTTVAPTTPPGPDATPTMPATGTPAVKTYNGQYFTLQYPATWVITSVTTGITSRQTVQFRPSATSPVLVTVEAMYLNKLSASQLLSIDPNVTLGTLVSTSTATYHGLPWSVGIVDLTDSVLVQPARLEIAYANQEAPYKVELSTPPDAFAAYSTIFNTMLASFYPGG